MLTIGRDHMMPCVFALFGREVSLFVCLCVLFFCLFVLVRRKRLGKDFVAKHLLLYVAEFFCSDKKRVHTFVCRFRISIGWALWSMPLLVKHDHHDHLGDCDMFARMPRWWCCSHFFNHITSICFESFLPIWLVGLFQSLGDSTSN